MANALDLVMQMRREKLAREQRDADSIGSFGNNLIQGLLAGQNAAESRKNNALDRNLKERKLSLSERELGLKSRSLDQEQELLNSLLGSGNGSSEGGIAGIQKNLPPGVSLKVGDFTLTGSKVGESQKKLINEIQATKTSVETIASLTNKVPDLGGIGSKGKGATSDIIGLLPRGLEGGLRSFISEKLTAGEGGGISGLSKEEDENFRTYVSNLPTFGGELYKALSGDTGRLSDFDIERGKNLAWRPDKGETPAIRDKKNKVLRAAVEEREKAIKNGSFTIDPESGAILTPNVLARAEAKLAGVTTNKLDKLQKAGLDPNKFEIVE